MFVGACAPRASSSDLMAFLTEMITQIVSDRRFSYAACLIE
jgi:hypothetical protein